MKPRFVSCRLLPDGTVEAVDDDGEVFHVQMRKDQAWPLLSRQVRRFELKEAGEKPWPEKLPPGPPSLKVV